MSHNSTICLLLIAFTLATNISIFFDIPIFRQVLGFVFLTIIPGFLLILIFRLDKISSADMIVLSIGLSVSIIMILGLLISYILPLLGNESPLSSDSAIVLLSGIVLLKIVIVYFNNRGYFPNNLLYLNLDTKEKALILIPSIFPILSIFGIHLMNTTNNNSILIALYFLISIYVIFIGSIYSRISDKIFPIMVFFISISLALLFGLRSGIQIMGSDVQMEFYVFLQTISNGKWQIILNSTLDTCLSISVLPAIYYYVLNLNPVYLFKIFYCLLFSIAPLAIYQISRRCINSYYSLLASLFFMSSIVFLHTAYHPRTTTAILFISLSVMVLLNEEISYSMKKTLFIIFAASCVFSHYSTAYIFIFILLLTWLLIIIISKILIICNLNATNFQLKNETITQKVILLIFLLIFIWYSQITDTAFEPGVRFIQKTGTELNSFFIGEIKEQEYASLPYYSDNILYEKIIKPINIILFIVTKLLIMCGVVFTLRGYLTKSYPSTSELNINRFFNINVEFVVFALACGIMWVITLITLTQLSSGYGLGRAELVLMVSLSPFIIIGASIFAKYLKIKTTLIIIPIIILFFLYNAGVVHQICGIPLMVILNSQGQQYDELFIFDQEIIAGKWLNENIDKNALIYTDWSRRRNLIGGVGAVLPTYYSGEFVEEHSNPGNGYFFLGYRNLALNKLMDRYRQWHDFDKYYDIFHESNLVYTNKDTKIFYK